MFHVQGGKNPTRVIATHKESGYTFRLTADGYLTVSHRAWKGETDTVCVSMVPDPEAIVTYADMWLEEMRCMTAEFQ